MNRKPNLTFTHEFDARKCHACQGSGGEGTILCGRVCPTCDGIGIAPLTVQVSGRWDGEGECFEIYTVTDPSGRDVELTQDEYQLLERVAEELLRETADVRPWED